MTDAPPSEGTFLWPGVAYEGGRLYLMAESYPIIIVANSTAGRVLDAFGIPGQHEFSDISVSNEQIVRNRSVVTAVI